MPDGANPQQDLLGHHKAMRARVKSAGSPSAAQLAAINATHALVDLTDADICVRTFAVCHNAIDRDNECFSSAILADFARTLPGKGAYIRHPGGWNGDGMPAEGRWFEATVERMSFEEARALLREPLVFPPDAVGAEILMASAYFARDAGIDHILRKMDAGIVGDVSISFTGKGGSRTIVDAAGRELEARQWQAPDEALEASLVWIGAQQGARAIKSATQPTAKPEPNMPTEKTPQEKALDDLREKAAAAEGKAAKFDAVATAIGVTLADDPAKAKLLVDAGTAYRKSLIDSIVLAEREGKRLGDGEADVAAAVKDYDNLTTPGLERLAIAAKASIPTGGNLAASDPGAAKPSAGTGTESKGGFVGMQPTA